MSLGNGMFIVVEQEAPMRTARCATSWMLVEVPATATDIAAIGIELEKNSIDGVTTSAELGQRREAEEDGAARPERRRLEAEKAEGLAIVDGNTLALINDNDFGLKTVLADAKGKPVAGDPTECTVDVNGVIAQDGTCAAGAVLSRVTRGNEVDRLTHLWLFKFPKALNTFSAQCGRRGAQGAPCRWFASPGRSDVRASLKNPCSLLLLFH